MNYKEKYEQALNRAKKLYEQSTITVSLGYVFPELIEDEDEKIRKELIEQVAYIIPNNDELDDELNTLPTYQKRIDKYRAWLEKQDEKKSADINGEDYGIDGLYHAIRILEGTVGKVIGYQSDDGILEHKAAINAVKELYKKQDKIEPKKLDADDVIAWLVANILNYEYFVKWFKIDFGLTEKGGEK